VVDGPVSEGRQAHGGFLVVDGGPDHLALEAALGALDEDALQVGELLLGHLRVLVEHVQDVHELGVAAHALHTVEVLLRQTAPVEGLARLFHVDLAHNVVYLLDWRLVRGWSCNCCSSVCQRTAGWLWRGRGFGHLELADLVDGLGRVERCLLLCACILYLQLLDAQGRAAPGLLDLDLANSAHLVGL